MISETSNSRTQCRAVSQLLCEDRHLKHPIPHKTTGLLDLDLDIQKLHVLIAAIQPRMYGAHNFNLLFQYSCLKKK